MRWYWWLRAKFQRWNYKRKYGKDIDEAMKEYGRHVILTEKVLHAGDCKCKECDEKWITAAKNIPSDDEILRQVVRIKTHKW